MSKRITLPSAVEIVKRLRSVYDDDYMAERFYSLIAQEAGHELVAEGVVMMFTLKIYDFVTSGYPEVMTSILHGYVPLFIDALIDDKEVSEAAKSFHQNALDSARDK